MTEITAQPLTAIAGQMGGSGPGLRGAEPSGASPAIDFAAFLSVIPEGEASAPINLAQDAPRTPRAVNPAFASPVPKTWVASSEGFLGAAADRPALEPSGGDDSIILPPFSPSAAGRRPDRVVWHKAEPDRGAEASDDSPASKPFNTEMSEVAEQVAEAFLPPEAIAVPPLPPATAAPFPVSAEQHDPERELSARDPMGGVLSSGTEPKHATEGNTPLPGLPSAHVAIHSEEAMPTAGRPLVKNAIGKVDPTPPIAAPQDLPLAAPEPNPRPLPIRDGAAPALAPTLKDAPVLQAVPILKDAPAQPPVISQVAPATIAMAEDGVKSSEGQGVSTIPTAPDAAPKPASQAATTQSMTEVEEPRLPHGAGRDRVDLPMSDPTDASLLQKAKMPPQNAPEAGIPVARSTSQTSVPTAVPTPFAAEAPVAVLTRPPPAPFVVASPIAPPPITELRISNAPPLPTSPAAAAEPASPGARQIPTTPSNTLPAPTATTGNLPLPEASEPGATIRIHAETPNLPTFIEPLSRGPVPGTATPPPAPPLPLTVPVTEIAALIGQIGQNGPEITEISLSPEELGRLRLHLIPDGDRIQVILSAERPETLDLLRRNLEQFTADLRQMGFSSSAFGFAGWAGGQDRGREAQALSPDPISEPPISPPVTSASEGKVARADASATLDLRL